MNILEQNLLFSFYSYDTIMGITNCVRIYLRQIKPTEADFIYSYRSLESIAKYQYWEPYTKEQATEFANRYSFADINKRYEWLGFMIVNKTDHYPIGDCAVKIRKKSAEIGCNISPVYQNKGFAKEALKTLFDLCFGIERIIKIYGITDSNNTASIRLMKSVGMTKAENYEKHIICKGTMCIEHKYILRK